MAAAMRAGYPQSEIAAAAAIQAKNVAQRSKIIVGTNQYAQGSEEPLPGSNFDGAAFRRKRAAQIEAYRTSSDNRRNTEVMAGLSRIVEAGSGEILEACVAAVRAGATLGEVTRTLRIQDHPDEPMPPVTICRVTEGYEKLRLAVIEHGRRAGARPKVFLAAMGPVRQHKARADFSRGYFEVAGFTVVGGAGYPDAEAAAGAAANSGTAIVVICSTDETYPDLVPPLAGAIRARMPGAVLVLAGFPKDQVDAHKASGVEEFIHVRSDALETLTRVARRVGVAV